MSEFQAIFLPRQQCWQGILDRNKTGFDEGEDRRDSRCHF